MSSKPRRTTPRLSGKRDRVAQEKRRLAGVALLTKGLSQSEVARRLGVRPQAVSKWAAAKAAGGVKALASKGKPGRKTAPSASQLKQVETVLVKGAIKSGYRNDLWTLERIAEVFARVTGEKRPSVSRTWQLLRAMGWSNQRPARRARQQNAEAVAEFREKTWVAVKKKPNDSGN